MEKSDWIWMNGEFVAWEDAQVHVLSHGLHYGTGVFDLEFDVVAHRLLIRTSLGEERSVPLEPQSVARFHERVMAALADLGVEAPIRPVPTEVESTIPFPEDHTNASYDAAAVTAYWRQLIQAERVITRFRAEFLGKVSPVHYFWGAMDLACTRFSGRPAPRHPGGAPNCADWVMEEGYSHELSSCGFWAGGGEEGAFYAYADVRGLLGKRFGDAVPHSSAELAELVLERAEIAVVPGEAFGPSGFLRLSYALGDDDLAEGLRRLQEFLGSAAPQGG